MCECEPETDAEVREGGVSRAEEEDTLREVSAAAPIVVVVPSGDVGGLRDVCTLEVVLVLMPRDRPVESGAVIAEEGAKSLLMLTLNNPPPAPTTCWMPLSMDMSVPLVKLVSLMAAPRVLRLLRLDARPGLPRLLRRMFMRLCMCLRAISRRCCSLSSAWSSALFCWMARHC